MAPINVIVPNRTRVAKVEPSSGTFDYAAFVELTSGTPGATIYYTTDGSDPDSGDTLYTGPFAVTATATVKTLATRSDKRDSAIASASLTVNAPPARHDVSSGTYIEAEAAQGGDGYLLLSDARTANGVYVLLLDDQEDGDDEYIDVDITCQATGTYYLWIKSSAMGYCKAQIRLDAGAYADHTVSSSDSFFQGHDWHWQRHSVTFSLTSSTNYTFRIRRKTGLITRAPMIDRLFFTTSSGASPPALELIHPNGGERWPLSTNQVITWQSDGDTTNIKIEFSDDEGETWEIIIASTADDGSYTWTNVPGALTEGCRIRITDTGDAEAWDESDGDFCITSQTNPFDTSIKMRTKIHKSVGKYYYEQGDRDEYLAWMVALGEENLEVCLYSKVWLSGNVPDVEAIAAFRSNNTSNTILLVYNNLYTIASRSGGAMLGDLSAAEYDDWFLYDELDNIVKNPVNARPCFDFRNTDVLDYFVERTILFLEAGTNGFEFDCYQILSKRVWSNGYWHDTGLPYSGDIEIQNPRTSATYTAEDWIADVQYATSYIRRKLDAHYNNRDTVMACNADPNALRLGYLDAFTWSYLEGFFGNDDIEETIGDAFFDNALWERHADAITAYDLAGHCTIGRFGYVTGEPWTQNADSGVLYIIASALMAVRGPDTRIYIHDTWHHGWDGWDTLRLARFVPEERYYKTSDDVYKRKFQHAVVYCNPTKTDQAGISLGDDYYYLQDNGTWSVGTIDTLSLDAGRGAILVLDTTWGS